MKKIISLLIIVLILLTGCQKKPVSKEPLDQKQVLTAIEEVQTNIDNWTGIDGEFNIRLQGKIEPSLFTQDRVKETTQLNLTISSLFQGLAKDRFEAYAYTTFNNLDKPNDKQEIHTYLLQVRDQLTEYEYKDGQWQEKSTQTIKSFSEEDITKIRNDFKSNLALLFKNAEFEVNPEVVMVNDTPTTELSVPIADKIFEEIQKQAQATNSEDIPFDLIQLLGPDFFNLTININNDTKQLKRLRLNVKTDSPIFALGGLSLEEAYLEIVMNDYNLTQINPKIELPKIK